MNRIGIKTLTFILFSVFIVLTGCATNSDVNGNSDGKQTQKNTQKEVKADNYPSKKISLVIQYKPGAGGDVFYRSFARIAEKYIDVPIIIENKSGGSGALAINEMLGREADGHTILGITQSEAYSLAHGEIPQTIDDIKPISSLVAGRSSIFTAADAPYKTFEDLLKYGLGNPGKMKFLSIGTYNNNHVTALSVMDELGIDGQYIPFESPGESDKALMNGSGDVAIANVSGAYPMVDEGTLRFLAIGGDERLEKYPDVPLFHEIGIKDTNDFTYRGFGVKPGTPQNVIDQFNELVKQVSEDPEWLQYIENTGEEIYYKSDEEFTEVFNKSYELGKNYFDQEKAK